MNPKRITFLSIFLTLTFILGIILRFTNLGSAPLSESEANLALQALQFSKGIPINNISPQPGYIVLTGILFYIFGTSNFIARFWGALAGSLLVLVPLILFWQADRRNQVGDWTVILLAIGLAVTPGLVVSSRLIGSPVMAISFLLLAVAFYSVRQPILAGFTGGLAALSGPAIVNGILILGLTGLIYFLLNRGKPVLFDTSYPDMDNQNGQNRRTFFIRMLVSLFLTLLLVATAFFRFPEGLAAWIETLPAYLSGWATPSNIPVTRMLAVLVLYQPVAVLFGLVGIVRALFLVVEPLQSRLVRAVGIWLLVSLLLTLVYPGRQIADLVWVIAPFWLIAAWEIHHYVPQGKISIISVVQALLLIVLMGLLWYSLVSMYRTQANDYDRLAKYVVIVGILALGALITVLIQLGWSWEVARLGLAWGIIGGLVLYAVSMLWGAAYLYQNQPNILWSPGPATQNVQTKLLLSTLQDLSYWKTGRADSVDIVSEVDTPAMRWLLRNYPNTRYENSISATDLPSILITGQEQATPALSTSYRGQDFTWTTSPNWSGALPDDYLGWLTFKAAPLSQVNIILWARSDLFPGGVLTQPANPAPNG